MTSNEIRRTFLEFFKSKMHEIVPSAPMVLKDDPTLMFTNAGMNQFKDYFLGNKEPESKRIADTQKCLRVSGKHNDLEEVGIDSYHHTMFEMLGNWSFGDYFKKEAIDWAWEFLTEVIKLDKDRLYVSIFEGDAQDGLERDTESEQLWQRHVAADRILAYDRKDNFWEMGETGPCGPCSEIHIDLRPDEARQSVDGKDLVNQDHPLVVEIWNLVFIEFNRKDDQSLVKLPAQHVDTGMGFERLCMAVQNKQSNYDTDVFWFYIEQMQKDTGIKYTSCYEASCTSDIAMRVIADHLRAVCFAIADGCLPSNTGSGYVIRRILRRAVRYYYSYLNVKEAYIHTLVPLLVKYYDDVFPEVKAQASFIATIIEEEEKTFLNTLAKGLDRLRDLELKDEILPGEFAFELYDTYGFPIDLTALIAKERGWSIDYPGFQRSLENQKARSRKDANKSVGDWEVFTDADMPVFVGYDEDVRRDVRITRARKIQHKDKEKYQITLDVTPFYAEGGGQIGDSGLLRGQEDIKILNTTKDLDMIVHEVDRLPENKTQIFVAEINAPRRRAIEKNHSATHLLHAALRQVLGDHVQQKGSLVTEKYLRFDFAHFKKMSQEELDQVEEIVNKKIAENIPVIERRSIPIEEAKDAGAMMLFGEKYGNEVRMITFDPAYSVELCGGAHVASTATIGIFKIIQETAVAAGIRRIEARTSLEAERYIRKQLHQLQGVKQLLKQEDVVKATQASQDELKVQRKAAEEYKSKWLQLVKQELLDEMESVGDVQYLFKKIDGVDADGLKNLCFQLNKQMDPSVIALASSNKNKALVSICISKSLVESNGLSAKEWIKEISPLIKGGGGGQDFFATAGGADATKLDEALNLMKASMLKKLQ